MKVQEPLLEEPAEAEILICAIDCGKYAADNPDEFNKLRDVAVRIARHRLIHSELNTDLLGVFKLGSRETKHPLYEAHGEGYSYIERSHPVVKKSIDAVIHINSIEPEGKDFIFLDAVEALGYHLEEDFKAVAAKKKRVVLFSRSSVAGKDLSGEAEDELKEICNIYCDKKVKFDVICADWPEDFEGDDDDDDDVKRDVDYYFEKAKKAGYPLIWAFSRATGGYVLGIDEAIEEADRPKAKNTRAFSRFRGTLDIGSVVKIPVKAFYLVTETKKAGTTKLSWSATRSERKAVPVLVETQKVISATDPKPLELEQLIFAYPYGTDLIPVDSATEEEWTCKEPCNLSTIAFIPVDDIPPQWFASPVSVMIPMADVHEARVAMEALVQALHDEQRGILAKFVRPVKGGAPGMAFLWPVIETERGTGRVKNRFLYIAELPLKEHMKDYPFNNLKKVRGDLPLDAEATMDSFINSRMLGKSNLPAHGLKKEEDAMEDDGGDDEDEFPDLKVSEEYNPTLDRFAKSVVKRAMEGIDGSGFAALEEWQRNLFDPNNYVAEGKKGEAEESLKRLKVSLPVSKVPAKTRRQTSTAEALSGAAASISDFLPPETADGEILEDDGVSGEGYLGGEMEF